MEIGEFWVAFPISQPIWMFRRKWRVLVGRKEQENIDMIVVFSSVASLLLIFRLSSKT